MAMVSKDIINIKFKNSDTLKECYKKFCKVMHKHGIKQGTLQESGGVRRDNPEWVICRTLFLDRVRGHFEILFLSNELTPKNLRHY